MRAKNWIGLLLVGALGAAGCGGDDSSADEDGGDATSPVVASTTASTSTTTSATVPAAASPAGSALFEDSFDDDRNGWGIVDDPEFGSATFVDGDYVWEFRGSIAHWLPSVIGEQYDSGELEMRDVVVRADATILAGGGVIGVFCRETPDTDAEWQWYEFVARDGFAAIRRSDSEGNLEVLAETHDVSLPTGQPIAIEAACVDAANGDAQLSMALNGAPVLDATDDDALGNGVVGLQAWTFPLHEQIDIRWHEFSVHRASSDGTATTTAAPATADVHAFCQAEVAVEAAAAGEQPDPTTLSAAFDALVATAPEDIKPAVQTAVDEASAFLAAGGDSTPAFDAAHEEILDYVQATCGFTDLSATGSEYAFGGLPATVPAGPALVSFENIGAEVHMMLFARIHDDATETLDELLALPEDQVVGKVTDVGTAFAEPGATGRTVVDLQPGRYAVVCFIPEGATPENMPAIASGELEGAPHAMLGMAQEIEAV